MALIANYSDLQTAIPEWLWRAGDTALAGRTDALISLFEASFARKQRTLEMQSKTTATIAAAASNLPSGFLEMVRVQITGEPNGIPNQVLTYLTPDAAATMDALQATQTNTARYYTILAGQIVITPQVSAPIGATLEIIAYAFTPLRTATTNWLITSHPDIYLYGSLMQGAAYIDDKESVGEWKSGLDEAMDELLRADNKKKAGGSPLVQRPSMSFVGGSSYSNRR